LAAPVLVPVGRVDGAGGGTLRPVVGFGTDGFGTPPFAAGGFGAETTVGPFGKAGLFAVGLFTVLRPALLGGGRSAGAGGGAAGVGLGAGISSLR